MKQSLISAFLVLTLIFGIQMKAGAEIGVSVVFSAKEISIIAGWYEDHRDGKPGKKAKGMPPGIAKNLARGKPLPPGIAKQYLPAGLRDLLPPPPKGYERVIVDGRIMLVEIATRVIHDILTDVVLR